MWRTAAVQPWANSRKPGTGFAAWKQPLGIRCYDAELIQKLAAGAALTKATSRMPESTLPGGFLCLFAFTDRSFGPTNEDLLWKLQYRIIRELAEKEPCVIVGRCADFILQDRTEGV